MILRGERRDKQLLDDKIMRGYCKLKEEALDATVRRTRYGKAMDLSPERLQNKLIYFLILYITVSRACRFKNDGEYRLFLPPHYTFLIFISFFSHLLLFQPFSLSNLRSFVVLYSSSGVWCSLSVI